MGVSHLVAMLVSVLGGVVFWVKVPGCPPPLNSHLVVQGVPTGVAAVLQVACALDLMSVCVVVVSEAAICRRHCPVVWSTRRCLPHYAQSSRLCSVVAPA